MPRKKNSWKRLAIISAFLIIIGIMSSRFIMIKPGTLEIATSYFIYPVLVIQHSIIKPIRTWFDRRQSIQELETIATNAYNKEQKLLAENIELQSLVNQWNNYSDILAFKQRYKTDYGIAATILLKNLSDSHHFILIDAGANRGVKTDMVVVHQNCLLGRITEVFPYYSKAMLITDRACKVAAQCIKTQAQGIHQGINTLDSTLMTYVNHLAQLQENDLVISSGEGLVFPKGFGLGYVASWHQEGFQYQVLIKPILDIRSINTCMIIQKGAEFDNQH